MLFDKSIEPSCSYCRYGICTGETEVICEKRGPVSAGGFCGKFRYDPLKRTPPRPRTLQDEDFSPSDFTLEQEQEK